MPLSAFALILLAGVIHASWNIAAKKANGDARFSFQTSVFNMLIWAPVGITLGWNVVPGWGLTEWGFVVLSGVLHIFYFIVLLRGYRKADLTVVYPLARGSGPLLSSLVAVLFLGEKISLQKLSWLGLAFLGMLAIVSAHGEQGAGGDQYLLGIALALGAALLYAFAALIIKRLTGTPPHLIALIQVCTGVLLLAPWANWAALPQTSTAWASLLTLGIVHTGVMYVLLYGAIQKLPTALTGALSFIYPIAAILVDWLAFGHRLGLLQWIGVAAILLAAAGMQQGWGSATRKAVTS